LLKAAKAEIPVNLPKVQVVGFLFSAERLIVKPPSESPEPTLHVTNVGDVFKKTRSEVGKALSINRKS
jgi:hypothetical protein